MQGILRHRIAIGICLIVVGMGLWFAFYPVDWQNWLGFSKSAYFTTGQNYAFLSGFGPCLITALGLSTLAAGLWHHVNCHEEGCARIGRHHVNGQVWCRLHHEAARAAVPADPVAERLDRIIELLEAQAQALKPAAPKPAAPRTRRT